MNRLMYPLLGCMVVLCLCEYGRAQKERSRLDGVVQLDAQAATIHGSQARFQVIDGLGTICYWTNSGDWLEWEFTIDKAGAYVMELKYSCQTGSEGSTFDVQVGDQKLASKISEDTGTWYDHSRIALGRFTFNTPGRELTGNTPVIFLLNAQDTYMGYPGGWLSGKGKQQASFALVAHDGPWNTARIPQLAWEYNCPPVVVEQVGRQPGKSFVEASDNVIVEAMRREGRDIELRMVECLGQAGTAQVTVTLPHEKAALTDLVGGRSQPLAYGPRYEIRVRPQQIITMRLTTTEPVPEIQPLLKWDELVPANKLAALKTRLRGRKGHPPLGSTPHTPNPTLPADAATSLTVNGTAIASNVYQNSPTHQGAMAIDGNPATRWATDATINRATLDVDLGTPQTFDRAYLSEAYDRVRQFELQALRDGTWQTFARGGKIGTDLEISFSPVTAQQVRLTVTDGPGGPTIWEFMLFAPK